MSTKTLSAPKAQTTQPTPIPTAVVTKPPSPTPTPTIQQVLGGMLNSDSGVMTYAGTVDVLYSDKAVTIDADLIHTDTDSIKWATYNILHDVYTSSEKPISKVTILFTGLLQDKYGKQSTQVIASVILTTETASKFVWGNLDENSAWNVYDTALILN